MGRRLDVFTSFVASVLRFGAGYVARPRVGQRPSERLRLYDFEACPFCRKVREAISELDLEVLIVPCPRGGRHRAELEQLGGKVQVPFLVDPNTGTQLYDSRAIVRYLVGTYGGGRAPRSLGPLSTLGSGLVSGLRAGHGRVARPSSPPSLPLVLYGFEASPYCRLVRERLCELELPYHLVNVAKRSGARAAFVEKSGKMQVPYLEDPNQGRALFESADILDYLDRTYGTA